MLYCLPVGHVLASLGDAVLGDAVLGDAVLGDAVLRVCAMLQIDDPLDAIAVHAFNGTWGVWAVGFFAAKNQVMTSYGANPYTTDPNAVREYGCFLGGSGRLLAAQIVYSIWLGGVITFLVPAFV